MDANWEAKRDPCGVPEYSSDPNLLGIVLGRHGRYEVDTIFPP